MKTMEIDGVKYRLVPISENEGAYNSNGEAPGTENDDILKEYASEPPKNVPREAKPKVSEYREKFKSKKLSSLDVSSRPSVLKEAKRQDSNLDQFGYAGERLFFGSGLEQEI